MLPFGGNVVGIGNAPEGRAIGPHHKADDLRGPVLVGAVARGIVLVAEIVAIALAGQHPAARGVFQRLVGLGRVLVQQHPGGKIVRGILFLAHHRQLHPVDQQMGHFVVEREQAIVHGKAQRIGPFLLGEARQVLSRSGQGRERQDQSKDQGRQAGHLVPRGVHAPSEEDRVAPVNDFMPVW